MKILALDLSSARGSIAFLEDGRALLHEEFPNDRKHSGLFFENLQRGLDRHKSPDTIVVGLGPGSYAGTRIAISTAIGLQIAQGARLLGLSSLCALDAAVAEYFVIGDARRESFFIARVRERALVEGPDLLSEIELRDRIGNSAMSILTTESLPQFARAQIRYPSAAILAQIAQEKDREFFLPPLQPIYLREPHITAPKTR